MTTLLMARGAMLGAALALPSLLVGPALTLVLVAMFGVGGTLAGAVSARAGAMTTILAGPVALFVPTLLLGR